MKEFVKWIYLFIYAVVGFALYYFLGKFSAIMFFVGCIIKNQLDIEEKLNDLEEKGKRGAGIMESYIANTQAFLGIVQATISEEEFKKSCEAGEKMYEAFSDISSKYKLNMREMLNAVLSINVGVLEIMQDQMKEMKGEK